jgi:hypothetical protein
MELSGLEPLTLSMPLRCATNCAIAPYAFFIMTAIADFVKSGFIEMNVCRDITGHGSSRAGKREWQRVTLQFLQAIGNVHR